MATDASLSSSPPSIIIRWLRPTMSTPYLQLPTAPITASTVDTWTALTEEESLACEKAWAALLEEETAVVTTKEGAALKEQQPSSSSAESDDEDDAVGITIFEDKLFEVDVRKMELRPIYWRQNGPRIKVRRATWMYDENHPVPKYLADQLDAAYKRVQPWQTSYELELESASQIGSAGYDKLKYPLKFPDKHEGSPTQQFVIFEDSYTARITTGSTNTIFASSFFTLRRPAKPSSIPFIGTVVYYGYDAALAVHAPKPSALPHGEGLTEADVALESTTGIAISASSTKMTTAQEEFPKEPKHVGEQGPKRVTDLVLVVHGIGQGLASQYESWSFLYAVNYFRQLAKKQSALPSLSSIMREKQAQFLPVEWRTSLKLGEEEQRERQREGLDNSFNIADVTPKKSIPAIRELFNNVLIEIPYFMSSHRTSMIQSVCKQANRIYRLWCARNPGFEKYGRVHIIGHSLGSVLSAYILSTQPTHQPRLSEMNREYILRCNDNFIFNTNVFFTVGSPLAIFIHLNHTQIIARKGRERTKASSDDALARHSLGCFAVDSIYNIFHPSDPVAYLLNPCVDSEAAVNLPPSTVPNFNSSVMSGLSQRFSRMFGDVMPRSFGTPPRSRTNSPSPTRRPAATRNAPSGFELSGPTSRTEGTRAERRFAALNPHGSVDFQLNSEGNLSEYVDMLTAHTSYWQDPNLAAFVLVELFANELDFARTGLAPEANVGS